MEIITLENVKKSILYVLFEIRISDSEFNVSIMSGRKYEKSKSNADISQTASQKTMGNITLNVDLILFFIIEKFVFRG